MDVTEVDASPIEIPLVPDDEGTVPLPDGANHGGECEGNPLRKYRNDGRDRR